MESMNKLVIDLNFKSQVGGWENDEFNCFESEDQSEQRSLGHEQIERFKIPFNKTHLTLYFKYWKIRFKCITHN